MRRHSAFWAGLAVACLLASSCAHPRPVVARSARATCDGDGTLGIEVQGLTPASRARAGLAADAAGVLVTTVFAGGAAAGAGIGAGDVLLAVDGHAVADGCVFAELAYHRSCTPVAVRVRQRGRPREVTVTPVEARPFFAARCAAGDARACFREEWLRSSWAADWAGAAAIDAYTRACDQGAGEACALLATALGERTDTAEARVAAYQRGCALDDGAGCAGLAFLYATGTLVERDDARATPLYEKACDLGDAAGCYNVGLMYESGRGVTKDLERARSAYDEGCRGGHSRACTNLGVLLQHGLTGPADPEAAVDLYRRGCDGTRCEGPNLLGCVNLGRTYRDGIGMPADRSRAAEIFEQVCEGRISTTERDPGQVATGCALLGGMHLAGTAPASDAATGRALSERGCAGGDGFGCFNAATAHRYGLGGAAAPAAAVRFYLLGCDAGDAESCYEGALRLEAGDGAARDVERARALFGKACEGGFDKACSTRRP